MTTPPVPTPENSAYPLLCAASGLIKLDNPGHPQGSQAVERYAESEMPEKSRLYGNIALKAQSYCRQTVSTLAHMKDHLKEERIIRQMEVIHRKPRNELLSAGPQEALDTRRETAPVTIHPW